MLNIVCILIFSLIVVLAEFFPECADERKSAQKRKILCLVLSILFFLILFKTALLYIAVVTILTYFFGIQIEKSSGRTAGLWLAIPVTVLMGLLIFMKYGGFVSNVLNPGGKSFSIMIPLGFSYYSLMVTGYLIDVYRGEKAERNFLNYSLFVGFFPQVIAGPVGRRNKTVPQFDRGYKFEPERIKSGFAMIVMGLFEKFVLADNLKSLVSGIYESELAGAVVVLGAILYSLVIYFDFAGYSLLAIGAARMMGIELINNFDAPYFAVSIQDFWRRWHISLSTWFRDYLYIPLGGNKRGIVRRDINTMIVFVMSGAWHGGNLGFLLWGFLHGLFQVVEKHTGICQTRRSESKSDRPTVRKCISTVVVFCLVSFAWVPFYIGDVRSSVTLWLRMLGMGNLRDDLSCFFDGTLLHMGVNLPTVIVCLLGICTVFLLDRKKTWYEDIAAVKPVSRIMCELTLIILLVFFGAGSFGYQASAFIYGGF